LGSKVKGQGHSRRRRNCRRKTVESNLFSLSRRPQSYAFVHSVLTTNGESFPICCTQMFNASRHADAQRFSDLSTSASDDSVSCYQNAAHDQIKTASNRLDIRKTDECDACVYEQWRPRHLMISRATLTAA